MVNLDLPILNRVKNILTKTEKIDTDVTSVLTKLAEQGVDIDSIILAQAEIKQVQLQFSVN